MTESEIITKTIEVEGTATSSQLVLLEKPYPLSPLEYKLITKSSSNMANASLTLFIAGIGAAATPILEVIQRYFAHTSYTLSIKEIIIPLIILIFSALLFFLSRILPTDRKKILKKINLHFKNNPTSQGILKNHD